MLDEVVRIGVRLSYELEGKTWTRAWYFRDPVKARTFDYNLRNNTPMPAGALNIEVTMHPDPDEKPPTAEERAAGIALVRAAMSKVDGPLFKGLGPGLTKTPSRMRSKASKPLAGTDTLDPPPASTSVGNSAESSHSDALHGAEDLEDELEPF